MHSTTKLLAGVRATDACMRISSSGFIASAVQKLSSNVHTVFPLRHWSSRSNNDDGDFGYDWANHDLTHTDDSKLYRSQNNHHSRRHFDSYSQSGHKPRRWDAEDSYRRSPRITKPYRQQRRPSWYFDDEEDMSYGQDRPRRQRLHDFSDFDSQDEVGSKLKSLDWSNRQLDPVEKNFYVEHPSVMEMAEEEVAAFYSTHDITVPRGDKVRPVLDFLHANFPENVNKYVSQLSWTAPTPIQSLGWPIALSGKNMVGIAQTGSGKTLGFVLPALLHIKHQRQVARGEGPVVLILAPTRELAQQIKSVCVTFGRVMGVRSAAVFGGQSKLVQAKYISEGPEIIVATPGRLLDFLECGVISLERTTYLVLDEADRMLDMGFEPQIRKILSQIRPDRQLLLWSATWPQEIRQLAQDFLGNDFTQVNIGSTQLKANPNIEQTVTVCDRREKFQLLMQELEQDPSGPEKTLIFVQTKSSADFLVRRLRKSGFQALAIHGDKSQLMRDRTMFSFKKGETQILVATDVASRGLDVNDIELVVNFDYPNTADDYIHRIGRTARAQKTGRALTFITDEDVGKVKDLISVLTNASQTVPPELRDLQDLHQRLNRRGPKPRSFRPGFRRNSFSSRDY